MSVRCLAVLLVLAPALVVPQPPQQQQAAGGTAGGHAHGGGNPSEFVFAAESHNKDHIMDHLSHQIKTKSKEEMTEEELEFHYFKLHDYDNNNRLDGVEIGKALTHFHDDNPDISSNPKVFRDEEIVNIVDSVLKDNDADGNGYIEYFEFKTRQDTARSEQKTPEPPQP